VAGEYVTNLIIHCQRRNTWVTTTATATFTYRFS